MARILIIDDEELVRFTVREILGVAGHDVVEATNGAEALEKLAAGEPTIDAVICDIEMPEMDGYEFVRRVRYGVVPEHKDVPILMLTGQDTEKNVTKARIHKIDGFIVKPANATKLENHIRRVLGLSQT